MCESWVREPRWHRTKTAPGRRERSVLCGGAVCRTRHTVSLLYLLRGYNNSLGYALLPPHTYGKIYFARLIHSHAFIASSFFIAAGGGAAGVSAAVAAARAVSSSSSMLKPTQSRDRLKPKPKFEKNSKSISDNILKAIDSDLKEKTKQLKILKKKLNWDSFSKQLLDFIKW